MAILPLILGLLERVGSMVIKKEQKTFQPPDAKSVMGDTERFVEPELRIKTIRATVLAFVIFTPVCVATGGTFGECSDLFLKLGISEGV